MAVIKTALWLAHCYTGSLAGHDLLMPAEVKFQASGVLDTKSRSVPGMALRECSFLAWPQPGIQPRGKAVGGPVF